MKSVCIRSFSGPYFPAFGLNTERHRVSLHIQSECGKIRTRRFPNTGTFQSVYSIDTESTIWPIFYFSRPIRLQILCTLAIISDKLWLTWSIFCCYFTHLKAHEISQQNMETRKILLILYLKPYVS